MNTTNHQRRTICAVCGIPLMADRPKYHWGKCPSCWRIAKRAQLANYRAKTKRVVDRSEILGPFDKETIALRIQETHTLKYLCRGGDILPYMRYLPS